MYSGAIFYHLDPLGVGWVTYQVSHVVAGRKTLPREQCWSGENKHNVSPRPPVYFAVR